MDLPVGSSSFYSYSCFCPPPWVLMNTWLSFLSCNPLLLAGYFQGYSTSLVTKLFFVTTLPILEQLLLNTPWWVRLRNGLIFSIMSSNPKAGNLMMTREMKVFGGLPEDCYIFFLQSSVHSWETLLLCWLGSFQRCQLGPNAQRTTLLLDFFPFDQPTWWKSWVSNPN